MMLLSSGTTTIGSLESIVSAMQSIFTFFIGLFTDLFTTITSTPLMWAPLAISLLFFIVWKVPKMVRKLRKA